MEGSIGLLIYFLLVLSVLIFGWLVFYITRKRKAIALRRSVNLVLISVSVPHEEQEEKTERKNEKEIISVMDQFLGSLTKLRDSKVTEFFFGPLQLALEIANPHGDEIIHFYIAIPKRFAAAVEKQIYSFFPDSSVKRVPDDYNIFVPQSKVVGASMVLRKSAFIPFKNYKLLESDPLNNITNSFSKLNKEKEGASLQIVIRPASGKWRRRGIEVARKMKQGKSLASARGSSFLNIFWELFDPPNSKDKSAPLNQYKDKQSELRQLTPAEEELLKEIEQKALKPIFDVNIRLVASAETKERAEEILSHLIESFAQFDSLEMNGFIPKRPFSLKEFIFNYSFRNFSLWNLTTLSTEELSSIFHFPTYSTKTPKLDIMKSKTAMLPPNLPGGGLLLGENTFRGVTSQIFMKKEDRRRHFYVIGQTGTGKSNLLKEMIAQDIRNGEGVCVIDPHGDLIEDTLGKIPQSRIQDVILFDPADSERPIGLNLLEYERSEQKTFVINEMINIFDKLYDLKQTGGPMFEQYMRNAMLLIMDHPESGSTLMEISRVLADEEFRKYKLEHCHNQVVVDFWRKEAEKAGGEAALANMVPYITSKLTTFISNDIMRPIIAQQKSSFSFREAMDSQKIILINLSKGRIGELNANLLGMVVVGKILMSALSRVEIPEEQRKDFYLYIDEFQNVTTDSIASILSEARKYKLNLIIAHQFIDQLEQNIKDAVFGNVGSMVAFRIGANDSEFVVKQFAPTFSESDLTNVDNYKAFIKMMIDGQMSIPFSIESLAPSPRDFSLVETIKDYSRNKYGRDRAIIEEELLERIRLERDNSQVGGGQESDMPVK